MSKDSDRQIQHLDEAIDSLRKLSDERGLQPEEKSGLQSELQALRDMLKKLETGTVELTVFGEVSTGKSSLLNALIGEQLFEEGARSGVTVNKQKAEWSEQRKTLQGLGHSKLVLVDTPGLNEVLGEERALIAEETVRYSDLVLFVVKADLNDVEYRAIRLLHELNKPIIVVFNKVDIYNKEQRQEIHTSLIQRLTGMVAAENIVLCAGNPLEREYVVQHADGREETQLRKPKPLIEDLQVRILALLEGEGKAVVALNAALFATEVSDRILQQKILIRQTVAQDAVRKFMLMKAIAVALNPVPIADIVGGVAADFVMIREIGKIYGVSLSIRGSEDLFKEILKGMGLLGLAEIVTHVIANAMDITTFGLTTVVTAIPQGVAAGWASYIIGEAAHEYFKRGGSWGEGGPKSVVAGILKSVNRDSVIREIKAGVQAALKK